MRERPSIAAIVSDQKLPKMFMVRQSFPRPKIEPDQIPDVVAKLLNQEPYLSRVKPGMRIAITVGSRGVANVAITTKAIVDFVKKQGAQPFIVPAMGSHGGATAEGQRAIVEGYGCTEEYLGCPIISSMEVKKIGVNEEGTDVFIDKNAAEADGIIVSCRIKPHTDFRGPYESGMMKMMTIGLGKQHGAEVCHEQGFKNMAKNVPLFGKAIIKYAPILFAVPTIENAYDETCRILAVPAEEIEEREPALLKESFTYMPSILVGEADMLIVDQIGKNISGCGMDPNISGVFGSPYASGGLNVQKCCILDLTEETHGNATGVGVADAITKRLYEKMDLTSIYMNSITCTQLGGAKIPMIMESDKETIQAVVKSCVEIDKQNPRIVRIPNTLHISRIMLSESYYEQAKADPNLTVESEPVEMPFDEDGQLWNSYEEWEKIWA